MSRQGRLLAAQAVLSALILIVVYVTLLRPEGGGTLSGVEAPHPSLPPSGQHANNRADRGTEDRSGSNRRGGATARGTTVPGIVGTVPTAVAPAPTGEQPTDDQYSDTLELLRARIGSD